MLTALFGVAPPGPERDAALREAREYGLVALVARTSGEGEEPVSCPRG